MKRSLWVGILALFVLFMGYQYVRAYRSLNASHQQIREAWTEVATVYRNRATLLLELTDLMAVMEGMDGPLLSRVNALREQVASVGEGLDRRLEAAQLASYAALQEELWLTATSVLDDSRLVLEVPRAGLLEQLRMQVQSSGYRLTVVRAQYNDAVRRYNDDIRSMPDALFAPLFGHSARPMLDS